MKQKEEYVVVDQMNMEKIMFRGTERQCNNFKSKSGNPFYALMSASMITWQQ